MKENYRKCFKCGASPAEDPTVVLYRFPNPGKKNFLRCELWAKYCFPNGAWSSPEFQKKLFSEHRMLCHRHFKQTSFIDYAQKKLHRHAAPSSECDKVVSVPVLDLEIHTQPQAGPSRVVQPLVDISNVPSSSTISVSTKTDPKAAVHVKESFDKVVSVPVLDLEIHTQPQAGPSRVVQPLVDISNVPSSSIISVSTKTDPKAAVHVKESFDKPKLSQTKKDQDHTKTKKLYMRCRKYMKRICNLRNRIKNLKTKLHVINEDESVNSLMTKITPTFALMLQSQIKNYKKKSKGRRWSLDEKIVSLRMYKRSPTCYRLLRRLFYLPAPSTLKKLLGQFYLKPGINEKLFSMLRKYTETQNPCDNEYILMFDEMSIRKHLEYNKKEDLIQGFQDHGEIHGRTADVATHALVFMIGGIRKKVKQPVAFYLSGSHVTADRLAVLIKEVIRECFKAGVGISATVCDMDGVNRRALGILGASEERPSITIDNKEIVTMFDPPHLLKCFRNLFLKYDIKCAANISSKGKCGKGIAKWSHITKFYEIDSANPNFVFAPCLRKDHLNPNTKQKMKVKLAAQVFSHSVAAGMYATISQGKLTTEAAVTANFVSSMDKLFDSLNSETPDCRRGKPHATNLSEKSPHLNFFEEMKVFIKNMEFIGCSHTPPSQQGWIWTINAVSRLWYILKSKHKEIRSLATRRLQQDPLENLFGCIRANCGSNANPTVSQFIGGIKTAVLSNLSHMGNGNCEIDDNTAILSNFRALLKITEKEKNLEPTEASEFSLGLSSAEEFFEPIDEESGEIQACAYVCGFLIKNLKNKCSVCFNLFTSEETRLHTFVELKEYRDFKKSLNYASPELIQCVEKCATIINSVASTNAYKCDFKKICSENVTNINFDFIKKCQVHGKQIIKYILDSVFHITIKRFCNLKNQKFSEELSKLALKRKIEILKHN